MESDVSLKIGYTVLPIWAQYKYLGIVITEFIDYA